MNGTVPRPRTPDIPILKPQPAGPYPKRLTGLPAHTSGIVVGSTERDVTAVQRWVYQQWRHMRCGDARACDAASVAVALVSNAHRHTASGLPGRETTVTIRRGPFLAYLSVTDQGPRPGVVHPSLPELRPDRSGMLLVDHVSVFWDWVSTPAGEITLRAALEMP